MAAFVYTQEAPCTCDVSVRAGQVVITVPPEAHSRMVSSTNERATLHTDTPHQKKEKGVDGIPHITVGQFQQVTYTAFVKLKTKVPLQVADVQSVRCAVFALDEHGGTPLGEFWKDPIDAVYDTPQTELDSDGYNFEVEFAMADDRVSKGGSSYQVEAMIELVDGRGFIPQKGRVHVSPTYLLPIGSY